MPTPSLFSKVARLLEAKSELQLSAWLRDAMVDIYLLKKPPSVSFVGAELVIMDSMHFSWLDSLAEVFNACDDKTRERMRSAVLASFKDISNCRDRVGFDHIVAGYIEIIEKLRVSQAVDHFDFVIRELCPNNTQICLKATTAWISMVPTGRPEALVFAENAFEILSAEYAPIIFAAMCRENPIDWQRYLRVVSGCLGEELDRRSSKYRENYRRSMHAFMHAQLPEQARLQYLNKIHLDEILAIPFIENDSAQMANDLLIWHNKRLQESPSSCLEDVINKREAANTSQFNISEYV